MLITSSHAALIEVITDAPSIHALKSRLPRGTSLRDYFKQRYGVHVALSSLCVLVARAECGIPLPAPAGQDTQAYRTAQRNFVESMAGYSILSYLFQVREAWLCALSGSADRSFVRGGSSRTGTTATCCWTTMAT